MKQSLRILAATASFALLAFPAAAQTCGRHDDLTHQLNAQYEERTAAYGLTADGRLVEVFSSPNGSWTILLSDPSGLSCIMSYGESWQPVPVKKAKTVS